MLPSLTTREEIKKITGVDQKGRTCLVGRFKTLKFKKVYLIIGEMDMTWEGGKEVVNPKDYVNPCHLPSVWTESL